MAPGGNNPLPAKRFPPMLFLESEFTLSLLSGFFNLLIDADAVATVKKADGKEVPQRNQTLWHNTGPKLRAGNLYAIERRWKESVILRVRWEWAPQGRDAR